MDIQQKQQVEKELLTVIVNHLKNNQMDLATASSKRLIVLGIQI